SRPGSPCYICGSMRRRGVALFGELFSLIGCRTATQVTVELTTDVDCSTHPSTATQIEHLDTEVEGRFASVETTACSSSDRIGSFVIVPSGDNSDLFAVKILLARGRSVESCRDAEVHSTSFEGCIAARRALHFLPHTELTLPIALRQDCDN